ncbi:MAG: hypothetical protein AAFY60_00370 [Myxococcota bacterium]
MRRLLFAFILTGTALSPPACSDSTRRPQVVFQLEADTESNALASWVRVMLFDRDGQLLQNVIEPAGVLPAEIPTVARDDDPTRWVTIRAELFDTLESPENDDVPIVAVESSAAFFAGEVRYVPLRFSRSCLDSTECLAEQTCYRGVCRGACFEPTPDSESGELEPTCGRCQRCSGLSCTDLDDGNECGCPGDSCADGQCQGPGQFLGVSGGLRSTCVVRSGRVYCWGSNEYQELGVPGAALATTTPIEVALPSPAVAVSTRGNEDGAETAHSCALLEDGTLACWGRNGSGQLGLGPGAPNPVLSPTLLPSPTNAVAISVGGGHSCARTQTGELWCWGSNNRGQLGVPAAGNSSNTPVSVPSPTDDPWTSHCTGQLHSCAVSGGIVYCWGFNSDAQIGVPPGENLTTPNPIDADPSLRFSLVTCGDFHSCALADDQRAFCWGGNGFGNLGREPTELDGAPGPVNGQLSFEFLSCGRSHCCGLESGGSLWCWGRNTQGQLGVGPDVIDRFRPTRTSGPEDGWTALALGEQHSCAVREDQFLWCWGANTDGQLGLGDREARFNPSVVCLPPP